MWMTGYYAMAQTECGQKGPVAVVGVVSLWSGALCLRLAWQAPMKPGLSMDTKSRVWGRETVLTAVSISGAE